MSEENVALSAEPRVTVLEEWRYSSKDGSVLSTSYNSREYCDHLVSLSNVHFPDPAPFRVRRVALVDDVLLAQQDAVRVILDVKDQTVRELHDAAMKACDTGAFDEAVCYEAAALARAVSMRVSPATRYNLAKSLGAIANRIQGDAEDEASTSIPASEASPRRDCDYWKPIPGGGIALPCSCGNYCDYPKPTMDDDTDRSSTPIQEVQDA